MFSTLEIDALLSLINFHEDLDELSELLGVDVKVICDKLEEMK
jgi:hypothetical protein